jgi:MarR family 2-MHQ and catechol resistance regulon transcriptional repressor
MVHIPAHIIAQAFSFAAMLKLALAKRFDLNASQFLTLVLVGNTSRLSIKKLKERLSIPGSSLTFTLDALEKRGLIRRLRSKEDRRQWLVSLSKKGERLYTEILKAESEAISPALGNLSESEKAAFLRIAEEISR